MYPHSVIFHDIFLLILRMVCFITGYTIKILFNFAVHQRSKGVRKTYIKSTEMFIFLLKDQLIYCLHIQCAKYPGHSGHHETLLTC